MNALSKTTLRLFVLAIGLLGVRCSPAIDKAAVAAVQVSGASDAPPTCRLLGPLESIDNNRWVPGGPRYETAMLTLREKAVMGGGNRLQIDAIIPPRDEDYNPAFRVKARLFSCPADVVAVGLASAKPGAALVAPVATAPVATAPASVASVASPPPPSACEPDCSPGFTCLRGSCVSACNPGCTAGQRCGVDRICHPIAPVEAPRPVAP